MDFSALTRPFRRGRQRDKDAPAPAGNLNAGAADPGASRAGDGATRAGDEAARAGGAAARGTAHDGAQARADAADGTEGQTDAQRAQAAQDEGAARRELSEQRRAEGGDDPAPNWRQPLMDRPTVRTGIYAWSLIGIIGLAFAALVAMGRLTIVVVPLLLALFPAAVLSGPTARLKRVLPPAPAALAVLLLFLGGVAGVIALLAPAVASELGGLTEAAQDGAAQVQQYLEEGPLGFEPIRVDDLIQTVQDRLANTEGLAGTILGAAGVIVEGAAGLLFGLVVLFFYLKDGPTLGRWLVELFPTGLRRDAEIIGSQTWQAVGGYIRGQLLIALVDALLIGIAILVLGVPLVLPLSVLVFLGGLFPIVGAVLSGLIAVLVALATTDPTKALILLVVIVLVQQLEGDLLAPLVLGRAVSLHPLAVLASLTAGGVLLGVLGAFVAIPLVGSATRAVGYLRSRVPG